MDQLRLLAQITFNQASRRFKQDPASELRLLQLSHEHGTVSETHRDRLSEKSLLRLLATPPGHDADSALRLVVVARGEDDSIDMSLSGFRELASQFEIDPMVLQHIAVNAYGFHTHEHPDGHSVSLYIGTYVYSLAWSTNPVTLRTDAILLLRNTPILQNGDFILQTFVPALKSFKSYLYSPPLLLYVVYVHLCTTSRQAISMNVDDLRKIETLTGHGPGRGVQSSPQAAGSLKGDIDELSAAAQNIATTQVHLANLLRHSPYLQDLASQLQAWCSASGEGGSWRSAVRSGLADRFHAELADRFDAELAQLKAGLAPLGKATADLEPTVKYLQTRADCQSSVITSLMTHEDARLNTELAAAARRDSSAMRSIAMMTMAFLPGTFFAALFAMPSMPGAAQDKFWIYWVCTLPTTIIVMVVFRYHRQWKEAKLQRAREREREGRRRMGNRVSWHRAKGPDKDEGLPLENVVVAKDDHGRSADEDVNGNSSGGSHEK